MLMLLPIHRVSTMEQAGNNGEGLDRQRKTTRDLAKTHKATLLEAVEIIDVSGSDVDQTSEWRDRVVPAIADPSVHIVADSIDRILRAEAFNFRVFQDLLAAQTKIYTPGKIHDLTNPDDGFLAGLMALIGGREKAEIKRRVMAGREAARRRGEWPFKDESLPRGATFDRQLKRWGYDPAEAAVIRSVFHEYVVEGRALRALAREVGKPMQTIRYYLRNPIYKGMLVYDKKRGEPYPSLNGKQPDRRKIPRLRHEVIEVRVYGDLDAGQEEQLIDDQMWEAAQRRLAGNSRVFMRRREKGRADAWASGFLVSAIDRPSPNGFIRMPFATPERHQVYSNGGNQRSGHRYACRCARSSSGIARCGFRHPLSTQVDKTIDAYLEGLTNEGWFLDQVRARLDDGTDVDQTRRSLVAQQLDELDRREARLVGLYLDGRIKRGEHDRRQDQIRADRVALRAQQAELDSDAILLAESDVEKMTATWKWDRTWDHQRKRAWLSKYVHHIGLSNEGVEYSVIRIPAASGAVPVFGAGPRLNWVVPVFTRRAPRPRQG